MVSFESMKIFVKITNRKGKILKVIDWYFNIQIWEHNNGKKYLFYKCNSFQFSKAVKYINAEWELFHICQR